jgi:hypothetical protein
LRHEVTTGDNFTGIQQRIEDVQSVPEGTLTLSFYAKGTNPNAGSITIGTNQYFGTGGSPSSNVEVQDAATFTVTSSWQRFNFQLTVASISGRTLGTNDDSYFQIQFTQDGGDTSTDAWTLDITGVQLEVGSATPFEHRSFGDELARCQRYFWKPATSGWQGQYINTLTNVTFVYPYPVTMRATPSVTAAGGFKFNKPGSAGDITATYNANEKINNEVVAVNYSGASTNGNYGDTAIVSVGDISISAEL